MKNIGRVLMYIMGWIGAITEITLVLSLMFVLGLLAGAGLLAGDGHLVGVPLNIFTQVGVFFLVILVAQLVLLHTVLDRVLYWWLTPGSRQKGQNDAA